METEVLSPNEQVDLSGMKVVEAANPEEATALIELSPEDLSDHERGLFEEFTQKIESGGEDAFEAIANQTIVDYTEEARLRTEQLLEKVKASLEEEENKSGLDKMKESFHQKTRDLATRFKNDWTSAMRGSNYFQRRDALMETTTEDLTGIAEAYILSAGSAENFDKMGGLREFGYQEGLIPGKKLYTINFETDPHLEKAVKARAEEIRRQQKLNVGEYRVEKTPLEELERHLDTQAQLRQEDYEKLQKAREEKINSQENEINQLKVQIEELQQTLESERNSYNSQLAEIREQVASAQSSLEGLSASLRGEEASEIKTVSETPSSSETQINLENVRNNLFKEFSKIMNERGEGTAALRIESMAAGLGGLLGNKEEAVRITTEEFERAKTATESQNPGGEH